MQKLPFWGDFQRTQISIRLSGGAAGDFRFCHKDEERRVAAVDRPLVSCGPPWPSRVQKFAHGGTKLVGCHWLLYQLDAGVEPTLVHDRIARITRHIENLQPRRYRLRRFR
jgi:hypothetical protein